MASQTESSKKYSPKESNPEMSYKTPDWSRLLIFKGLIVFKSTDRCPLYLPIRLDAESTSS